MPDLQAAHPTAAAAPPPAVARWATFPRVGFALVAAWFALWAGALVLRVLLVLTLVTLSHFLPVGPGTEATWQSILDVTNALSSARYRVLNFVPLGLILLPALARWTWRRPRTREHGLVAMVSLGGFAFLLASVLALDASDLQASSQAYRGTVLLQKALLLAGVAALAWHAAPRPALAGVLLVVFAQPAAAVILKGPSLWAVLNASPVVSGHLIPYGLVHVALAAGAGLLAWAYVQAGRSTGGGGDA